MTLYLYDVTYFLFVCLFISVAQNIQCQIVWRLIKNELKSMQKETVVYTTLHKPQKEVPGTMEITALKTACILSAYFCISFLPLQSTFH